MRYIVTINGKNFEVEVEKGQASIINRVKTAEADLKEPVSAPTSEPPDVPEVTAVETDDTISGEPLRAPLPGNIVAIYVEEGASVKAGDILIVLEAMKMENEITAPKDGVVNQIMVSKGAVVPKGEVLLTLK
jgi:biotin carboxyl carrier protein